MKNRGLSIIFTTLFIAFFVMGCTKNDVAIEPISANEAARNLLLRDKYETLLFNHLIVRGELPMKNRFESIQNMAKDGFKPAELALALYDIEHTDLKTNDSKAEKALENLAANGDVTAQCLYAFYWKPEDAPEHWKQYVINSANAEVARCMDLRARYFEKDKSKEQLDWVYKAAIKGDIRGMFDIAVQYRGKKVLSRNIKGAVCCVKKAKEYESHETDGTYDIFIYELERETGVLNPPPPTEQFCDEFFKNEKIKLAQRA